MIEDKSAVAVLDRTALSERFRRVRQASIAMCHPLAPEMFRIQPMDDVSPPWWNLGHTSWFFVRNVLQPFGGRWEPEDDEFDYVLNSYYAALGPRVSRCRRGLLTRPTTEEIYRYRASVDERVEELLSTAGDDRWDELAFVLTVGIHHEQQHQELFYTEIKCILAENPRNLRQPYLPMSRDRRAPPAPREGCFIELAGGLFEFGHQQSGWCWDNELPVHKFYLLPFALESRLVTNAEYLAFIEDGGYRKQLLWLDNGWRAAQQEGWQAPLYWENLDVQWWTWTLRGMQPLRLDEPVRHVSFYEADAFARWRSETFAQYRGSRLPSEREWEHAALVAEHEPENDAFLDSGRLHPAPAAEGSALSQMSGVLWQWTSSYYEPYPGYRPFPGALAEYNGKFMDNQRVLRGGSCVTPRDHYRPTYRNFWAAPTRFQFTGIRLARDLEG